MIRKWGRINNYVDALTELQCEDFFEESRKETWRSDAPTSSHKDTQAVFLRMSDLVLPSDVFDDLDAFSCPILIDSPKVQDILSDIAYLVGASRIGRAMLVNLPPGGRVVPHEDQGDYCAAYRRFHLPIVTNDEVIFTCGDTQKHMEEGVLYEIDNKQSHHTENPSTQNRLHLIVDMQLLNGWVRVPQHYEEDEDGN